MSNVGIYRIISPTGRIYIGQSWDINKRFRSYKYKNTHNNQHLLRSFDKYGTDAHVFEIFHPFNDDATQEDLDNSERFYILFLKSQGEPLLNIREGGGGSKLAEVTKMKISATKTGKKLTEEQKIKWREQRKSFIMSDEARQKISDFHRGRKFTEEHKSKISIKTKERMKNEPVYECEHCHILTNQLNYKKWHGDKCKKK